MIGQEGIIDVEKFNLQGKDRKSMRNALNSLTKKGYTTEIIKAPLSEQLLDELERVSNEWLNEFEKKEIVFAEGKFDRELIENQTVIVLKDEQHKIVTFLNIITDYTPNELTYDMIRRTIDAPNGSMDAVIITMIEHAKNEKNRI